MNELESILLKVQAQQLPDGKGATTSHVRAEAKAQLLQLLSDSMDSLIGEDEATPILTNRWTNTDMEADNRNMYRAAMRLRKILIIKELE